MLHSDTVQITVSKLESQNGSASALASRNSTFTPRAPARSRAAASMAGLMSIPDSVIPAG